MSRENGPGARLSHRRRLPIAIGMWLMLPAWLHAQAAPAPAPAQAPVNFQVNEYLVRGNTLLDPATIEDSVEPYLGPGRSMNDVHAARDALQKLYQSSGYQSVVVEVPPQQVKNGVILLQVVENSIGRVRVVGAKYHSPEAIRDAVPSLTEGNVPNFTQVQQQLTDVNRQPDRQVIPQLSPGAMPQTMDVTLKVDDTNPWHGSVELNNDHSADTPDLRLITNVRYDNLWQMGQTISASYIVAPEDPRATEVYALSYLAPVSTNWSLLGSAYKSNSNANTLGGTTVLGKGNSVSLQATDQLPVLGDYSQSVSIGIARKHFDQNITLGGQTTEAPLSYVPLTASYTGQTITDKSTTSFTLAGNFGWRGLGSSNTAFDNQRYNARDNFAYLHLDLNNTRNLGAGYALATRLSAQATDSPLVSSEQFAAGGASSVRGYLSAEDTADNGAVASAEVRTPSIHSWLGSFADDWRFHVFVDGARLMLIDPLPDQHGRFTLLSTGVGTQFTVFHDINGNIEYAYPLRNGVETRAHDGHLLFSVKAGL
ncbi:ShlB/FhaC/HecB family hemolysin secretion/activation protein [Dyella dinghuensis]|uniref:ShlB/FhaC/HecB family hemolysin secretion/activation protein n=1 Tax=Dyella dinghuensis TaxID=1920169 RepID=A0A3S0RDE0_9GAMM|nr:ShlB/FhaC/HecB family hemolysin secretion/activation protein [Dyella dinghuensis]RUL63088.1 ShlB/FhaC/HecB family hemolysin secretion/activation protein [Dyella dinghuensis]